MIRHARALRAQYWQAKLSRRNKLRRVKHGVRSWTRPTYFLRTMTDGSAIDSDGLRQRRCEAGGHLRDVDGMQHASFEVRASRARARAHLRADSDVIVR